MYFSHLRGAWSRGRVWQVSTASARTLSCNDCRSTGSSSALCSPHPASTNPSAAAQAGRRPTGSTAPTVARRQRAGVPALALRAAPGEITATLVDVPSESGSERAIADLVENALRTQAGHLEVVRDGDAVLARTQLGRPRRVIFAGHLDTVPKNDNLTLRRTGSGQEEILHGLGTVDMKGGDAVFLSLAATVTEPRHDVTFVFYDCEEVDAARNGLNRIQANRPEWLRGDLAVVGEPSTAWTGA